jgi:protein O-GlcNAc transferase
MDQRGPTSPVSNTVAAQFQAALARQRQGDIVQAEAMYKAILRTQPKHAGALHLLGMMALQKGNAQRARDLIQRSIDFNPTRAEPHADLGSALRALGLLPEALASYDRALELKPDLVPALFNRGTVLQDLNRPAEALVCHDGAIELQPHLVAAHYSRALALSALKRYDEALEGFDRTLLMAPNYVEALSNRGIVLQELKRPAEALACFERALQLDPRSAKALNNRGNALRSLNRPAEALPDFERALQIDPVCFEALRNRGGALRELKLSEEALAGIDAALRLRPDCAALLRERAETLIDLKRYGEATECLARLFEVDPDIDYAQGLRLHLQRLDCDWTCYERRAEELVEATNAGRRADYPFPLLSVTDSAAAQLQCARTFVLDKHPAAQAPLWKGERYSHDRIRVAYVSGDLRKHVVSSLLVGVFEKHDRNRFETVAISLQPEEDTPVGRRVGTAFDTFIDVSRHSDQAAAALIRELEIDIAVDLMGFTKGSRTAILAHRAAPVQVNYLGYPGTMGAPYIDYILADEFVIPVRARDFYAEEVVYLPVCFQANDDGRASAGRPPLRQDHSLPESGLVLCCFNNNYKFNPGCFDIWTRLLRAAPDCVLWLLADTAEVESNLRHRAREAGVEPQRLIFAGRTSYAEHLARLQCADLFLDTVPFTGGTTASDVLWAGVPMLTCAGEAFAARMAGSLLTAVGLPELVTHSLAEYEARALELVGNPTLLSDARLRLAHNKLTAPLFNTERFTRHLEAAYTSMWERASRGEAPKSFAVGRL